MAGMWLIHPQPPTLSLLPDVTKWKSKGPLGEDPMKGVETQVKSAFTRAFNAQHLRPKSGFKLEDAAKRRGKGAAAAAIADDEEAFGGCRRGAGGVVGGFVCENWLGVVLLLKDMAWVRTHVLSLKNAQARTSRPGSRRRRRKRRSSTLHLSAKRYAQMKGMAGFGVLNGHLCEPGRVPIPTPPLHLTLDRSWLSRHRA